MFTQNISQYRSDWQYFVLLPNINIGPKILLELNAFAMFYEMWLTKFYDDDIQNRQDIVNLNNSTHKSKLYN